MPSEFDDFGDAREVHRLDQPGGTHEFEDFALCCFERVRILGANLDEQSSGLGIGFVQAEPQLAEVLLELRRELLADPVLADRVPASTRSRFFRRLLVGSGCTLAFIAEPFPASAPESPAPPSPTLHPPWAPALHASLPSHLLQKN
jgi:hypothetical protein